MDTLKDIEPKQLACHSDSDVSEAIYLAREDVSEAIYRARESDTFDCYLAISAARLMAVFGLLIGANMDTVLVAAQIQQESQKQLRQHRWIR